MIVSMVMLDRLNTAITSQWLCSVAITFQCDIFIAPELWHCLEETAASDIWSFGVILYAMLTGGNFPLTCLLFFFLKKTVFLKEPLSATSVMLEDVGS